MAILPGLRLLPDEFPDAYLRIFDVSHSDVAYMHDDVAIPLEPAGAKAQPLMSRGIFGRKDGPPGNLSEVRCYTCPSR